MTLLCSEEFADNLVLEIEIWLICLIPYKEIYNKYKIVDELVMSGLEFQYSNEAEFILLMV
jgi:hypothetical protein